MWKVRSFGSQPNSPMTALTSAGQSLFLLFFSSLFRRDFITWITYNAMCVLKFQVTKRIFTLLKMTDFGNPNAEKP